MKVSLGTIVNKFKRRSIRRRRMISLVTALSMFIASGVVWELRSVGITMVNDVGCGIEEHVHDESCYSHEFICGETETSDSDGNGHVHGIECFSDRFICDKPEHEHTLECFDDELLKEKYIENNYNQDQTVEIPDAEIVDNSENIVSDDYENEGMDDISLNNEADEEFSDEDAEESEHGKISLIGSKLGLINERLYVSSTSDEIFYYRNDGNHYEYKSPFVMYVGETAEFCIHGTGMTDTHPFSGNDYVDVSNDYRNSTDTHRLAKLTAKKAGETNVYVNLWKEYGKNLKLNIRDFDYENNLNKILLVKDDGSEVPGSSIDVKVGEQLTFCIYTDKAKTFDSGKRDSEGNPDADTIFVSQSYSSYVTAKPQDKFTRVFPDTREGHSGDEIRRYQVTYQFNTEKESIPVGYSRLPAYIVNVKSDHTEFDYNKLYHIYWVKDNGEEVLDEIPNAMPGETRKFCIYTDSTNTNNSEGGRHYLYSNNGSAIEHVGDFSENLKYHADEREGVASGSWIRRLEGEFECKTPGDYELLYNAVTSHKVHVVSNEYKILLKNNNEYIDLTDQNHYPQNNPYVLEIGESIDLIAYQPSQYNSEKDFFYNQSGVSDTVACTNKVEMYNGIRIVRGHVTAQSEGIRVFRFNNNQNAKTVMWINVKDRLLNNIYIVTNLGERSKNKVHEQGTTYEPNKNNQNNRYILYVDGSYHEKIDICVYTTKDNDNWFYVEDKYKNSIITVTQHNDKTIYYDNYKRVTATVEGLSKGPALIQFQYGTGLFEQFWIEVRDSTGSGIEKEDDIDKDHADIEIADGGYYEVNRTVYNSDGTRSEIYEKYDTYISAVNKCEIYDENKTAICTIGSEMYTKTGNPGEQQYEINSKQKTNGDPNYFYPREKVRSAMFDVDITMIPSFVEEKVYNTDGSLDKTTTRKLEDISKPIGAEKQVKNIIFNFGMTSIIDAFNKCSNHSGLDFNVTGRLNEILTQITFPVSKEFEDENGQKTTVNKTFDFQLSQVIDNNSRTVEIKSNESSGQIKFSDIYVQKTSDNAVYYHYTISELNPAGSDNGYIYYDSDKYGIQISDKKYDVYVKTFVNSNNCMETEYYTDSAYSHKFDGKSVFTNKVYKDVYNNFTVSKVWSDGNDKHQGENISFYVYQTDENGNKSKVVLSDNEKSQNGALLYKDGVFFDGSNQNWNVTIENLPYRQGLHTYTYSVEEINIRDGYEPDYSYNNSNTSCTVTNFGSDGSYLNIQKIWKDESGNVINDFSNFSIEAVNMNLKRKYAETIPVKVVLRESSNRNTIYCERMIQVYRNNSNNLGNPVDFSFKINPEDMMNYITFPTQKTGVTVRKNSGTIDVTFDKRTAVTDPKVYLDISSDHVWDWNFNKIPISESKINNGGGEYQWWSVNDNSIKFGEAYSTYNNTFSGDGVKALKIFKRTQQRQGARLKVNYNYSVLSPGKTCHITAYMCFDNQYEDGSKDSNNKAISTGINPTSIKLKISLNYGTDSDNKGLYKTVSSVDVTGRPKQWVKLEGDVIIPSNADRNATYFIFETEETNTTDSGKCVNLYLDDVVINGPYVRADVSAPNVSITYSSSFDPVLLDIADSDNFYSIDPSFSESVTLSKENSWKVKLDTRNLREENNVRYRYYLEEERLSGYKIPVYEDVNVSSNTSSKPMKIINQKAVDYRLPATGGTGPEKFQRAGLILIFFASAGFVIRRRVKRRSG